MTNTTTSSWGVNEKGEVVVQPGTGSTTIVGYISQDEVPVDPSGRFLLAGLSASTDPSNIFYVTNYGAKGDGVTDDAPAVNAALAALYTNKGGTLVFPFKSAGYKLGSSIVVDPGQYSMGSGIVIGLCGNQFKPTHTGWCFDIKTNFFGANNGGKLGNKPVIMLGDGANINNGGGNTAIGGVRWNDTVKWAMRDVVLNDYTGGTLVQLNITSNDLSTWVEHGDMSDISGSNFLNGLWCKSTNIIGSFLGNMFTRLAFEGRVNNCKDYWLQGLMFNCQFNMCGGYYNQNGTTGGCCFYLDGGYTGTTFISPWVDAGGNGTQSALTDFVFGPNYTPNLSYFPTLINTVEINLPVNWRDKMLVATPIGYGTLDGGIAASPREVSRSAKTFYVDVNNGDDTNNNGLKDYANVIHPFKTVQKAQDVIRTYLDAGNKDVILQLADGTYPAIVVQGNPPGIGAASFSIVGNTTTPGNVIVQGTNTDAFLAKGGARVTVKGIKFQTTGSGSGINTQDVGTSVYVDVGCQFGACVAKHMIAYLGTEINLAGAYTITGNAPVHYEVAGGVIYKNASCDATNRTFTNFTNVYNGGKLMINNTAFTTTGSVGTRYYVYAGGMVQSYGAANTIMPGNAAGYTDTGTGGLYL
jgi:hypothetical protein